MPRANMRRRRRSWMAHIGTPRARLPLLATFVSSSCYLLRNKMHDFCFTIPYGLILVVGGIIGYAKKGSMASLAGGSGSGLIFILAGYLSLKAFEKRKNSYLAFVLETVLAAAVTWVMGQRYLRTSKIMPAGIVAGISAVMTGFYLYKIATGGNHIPAKAE